MPYKFAVQKLTPEQDRRIKLSEDEREAIRQSSSSHRELAHQYNVSRRLIQFIKNPAAQRQNLLRREERGGWRQYYDKKKNTKAIREHRRYKRSLFVE